VIDWINKPIDHEQLVSALEQAITHASGTRPRVLHVEDDADIYRVVHAIVGEIAEMENAPTLAAARRLLKDRHFDLAILDVSLPDGSGMELLRELNSMTPPVPVMVFSAHEITIESIQKVGASLVKSRTDNAQLLATIKRMVGVE
jgi:DNA-binding NtrC family response regulator